MYKKEIGLWVIEEDELVEKILAEITFSSSIETKVNQDTNLKYWSELENDFPPEKLIERYLDIINQVYHLCRKIVPPDYDLLSLTKELVEVDVSFANVESYQKITEKGFEKEEDDDDDTEAIGHYSAKERIVALVEDYSLRTIGNTIKHELGHFVDDKFNPEEYRDRSPTMCEVMAILVAMELGCSGKYKKKKTPHHRAQKLLEKLRRTKFDYLDFSERWKILTPIIDHKIALQYIKENIGKKNLNDYFGEINLELSHKV